MPEYWFNEIQRFVSFAMSDPSQEKTDQWWQVCKFVEDFNQNRSVNIAAGSLKVLDKSMSAWRPHSTKCGDLPHISFIKCKPELLGTNFKNVADAATGIMLALEIQRGKQPMKEVRFPHILCSCLGFIYTN